MDWQNVLSDLKSRYKTFTFLMTQPNVNDTEAGFELHRKELLEEVSDVFDYWNKIITKCHEPVPPVVSKEYSNLRYEIMITLDYYNKFYGLKFK